MQTLFDYWHHYWNLLSRAEIGAHTRGTVSAVAPFLLFFLFAAANVLVHEGAHKIAFGLFGVPAKVVLLPGRFARFVAKRGRKICLSLGICDADDALVKQRVQPHQLRVIAAAGPLTELVFAIVVQSYLWHWSVQDDLWFMQVAVLLFCPACALLALLNWVPLRRIQNDGWMMWNPKAVLAAL